MGRPTGRLHFRLVKDDGFANSFRFTNRIDHSLNLFARWREQRRQGYRHHGIHQHPDRPNALRADTGFKKPKGPRLHPAEDHAYDVKGRKAYADQHPAHGGNRTDPLAENTEHDRGKETGGR